jgi:hypothetical protein
VMYGGGGEGGRGVMLPRTLLTDSPTERRRGGIGRGKAVVFLPVITSLVARKKLRKIHAF